MNFFNKLIIFETLLASAIVFVNEFSRLITVLVLVVLYEYRKKKQFEICKNATLKNLLMSQRETCSYQFDVLKD